MKQALYAIAIITLTAVCGASARAEGAREGGSLREQARAIQLEQMMERREQARTLQERRLARQDGGDAYGGDRGASRSGSSQEEGRGQVPARLSPDEKRALRRQIDQASHEIYSSR